MNLLCHAANKLNACRRLNKFYGTGLILSDFCKSFLCIYAGQYATCVETMGLADLRWLQ